MICWFGAKETFLNNINKFLSGFFDEYVVFHKHEQFHFFICHTFHKPSNLSSLHSLTWSILNAYTVLTSQEQHRSTSKSTSSRYKERWIKEIDGEKTVKQAREA